MPLILSLETATTVCSVAIAKDGKLLSLQEVNAGLSHSENLTVFIRNACRDSHISLNDLDAIAVSKGPGSYTGLRIGSGTAKGLCYALNKPLIGIPTLESLANAFMSMQRTGEMVHLLPMLDARRMEVYCAVYDAWGNEVRPAEAVIVNENSFNEILKSHSLAIFGDGSAKCKPLFENNPKVVFSEVSLSASGMVSIAEKKFAHGNFEDVSLFEPFYLKDAFIGSAKN